MSEPEDLTPKALRTRRLILHSAMSLFATRGYQETTLRDIAAEANCSLGLTYRYFSRKEELILELYRERAEDFERAVADLPRTRAAIRLRMALKADLVRLAPHRTALGALFGAGLSPESDVALLGDRVGPLRKIVWNACREIVAGASDAPAAAQCTEFATICYAAYLCLVLFWLQDRTPNQRATSDLLAFMTDMMRRVWPLLRLRPIARPVTRLAHIFSSLFGPPDALPQAYR